MLVDFPQVLSVVHFNLRLLQLDLRLLFTFAIMALKRLSKELRDLEKNKDEVFTLTPTSTDDLFHWTALLNGPKGSPYEGGVFTLTIDIPPAYPMDPPEVMFETKVYHPNISDSGDICLDTLSDQWSPALTLGKVQMLFFFFFLFFFCFFLSFFFLSFLLTCTFFSFFSPPSI